MRFRIKRTLIALIGCSVLCAGCGKLSTDYGQSRGFIGRTSLNGFGALRQAYNNAGFQCRDVSRLTDRVMRSDAIIWTPQIFGPIDTDSIEWFDRWLASGGKTLVYIIPDSGSESEYWMEAGPLAPPDQRLEYRKRSAKSVNAEITWRLNRKSIQDSGWFDVKPLKQREEMSEFGGLWASDLNQLATDPRATLSTELLIEQATTTTTSVAPAPAPGAPAAGTQAPGAPAPGAPAPGAPAPGANVPAMFSEPKQTGPTPVSYNFFPVSKLSATAISMESLLQSKDGGIFVAKVSSQDWDDSRIVVVAGGSLLTNFAFSKRLNRQLAAQLVDLSMPAGVLQPRASFITSMWSMIPVIESQPDVPPATGMELLTVWPISLITMHGVMLVLIVGLALLPIFGRPKRLPNNSQRDFGDHLDAVAALMNKAGDQEFARGRIREYRKRLHGESAVAANAPQLQSKKESS